MLIYSYINTSGNWKNKKLCGNTTPEGQSVFTQFRVFPIFTSVDMIVYFFICARLELFCDFLQFDWLHERAAFHDILARGPKELFFSKQAKE